MCDKTGALILARCDPQGVCHTNPAPETRLDAGHVLIAIGTGEELRALNELVGT